MLGIALRYGITLEELMTANPEVAPRFLSIGTKLVIPLNMPTPLILVTPTLPSLNWSSPHCFSTIDGGAWCFLLVRNPTSAALENISARIRLYTPDGEEVAGEVGIPPLNLLPEGEAVPIAVYFPPPLPEQYVAQADHFSGSLVPVGDDRYLPADVEISQVSVETEGLQATVQGTVSLPRRSSPASLVWVVVVAYGSEGEVVGVRRWETEARRTAIPPAPQLAPGGDLAFEVTVYSLGPPIDRIDVLVEARPF